MINQLGKQFNVVTIFPEMIQSFFREGLVGQAFANKKAHLNIINLRDFATDMHKTVDDRPYGGGDGMVFLAQPLSEAIESLGADKGKVICLSPQGKKWTDEIARQWAMDKGSVTLVCARYGGIDQRWIESYADEEVSIGDYILSGGELGASVIIDCVVRLLPEVLGNPQSVDKESFSDGLLECPLFTRPKEWKGLSVPDIFLSGHHQQIQQLRDEVSLVKTHLLRPDLFDQAQTKAKIKRLIKAAEDLLQLREPELRSLGLNNEYLKAILEDFSFSLLMEKED